MISKQLKELDPLSCSRGPTDVEPTTMEQAISSGAWNISLNLGIPLMIQDKAAATFRLKMREEGFFAMNNLLLLSLTEREMKVTTQ